MLLIVAFHATRTIYPGEEQPFFIFLSKTVIGSWGLLGVDLFLIISAWFLSLQQFRIQKVIHIVFQTFTWVAGYSIVSLLYDWLHCKKTIASALFHFCTGVFNGVCQPFWCKYYWFVTAYFFMLILFPFLNKLLNELTQQQVKRLLVICSFVPVYAQFQTSPVCDVIYFVYVFLLIGYFRKYGSQTIIRFAKPVYCISVIVLVIVSKIFSHYFLDRNSILKMLCYILDDTFANTGRHSIIILLISLLLFFYILGKEPTHNSLVNSISTHTLGVYLFHENDFLALPKIVDLIFGKLAAIGFFLQMSGFRLNIQVL